MRVDNEILKNEKAKQISIEREKDKKFIEDYNNLIEQQNKDRLRIVKKNGNILDTKIYVTPNCK